MAEDKDPRPIAKNRNRKADNRPHKKRISGIKDEAQRAEDAVSCRKFAGNRSRD